MINNKTSLEKIPVFFIFTPDIVQFSPFCTANYPDNFEPVFILNAVSAEDAEWIATQHPQLPVISLKTSLTGNAESLLGHAEVIDYLFSVMDSPFCIQDPDCFVLSRSYWSCVKLDLKKDFAAGPFTKKPTDHDHVLPDTFFLMLNPQLFKKLTQVYGISSAGRTELPELAQQLIKKLGYKQGDYPESFKGYFDTLQAYWLIALAEGYHFEKYPGEPSQIYHVGGTSYLHDSDYALDHWDYWPLSVIYLNLRLLEQKEMSRFRARHADIIHRFHSPERIKVDYPGFMSSKRYKQIESLLDTLFTESGES